MNEKDISSLRGALKFINEQDELLTIKNEVDPIYEISGISKLLDGSLGILFENIKGFPEARCVCNLLGTRERMAMIFDSSSHKETKFQALRAVRNPIPPKIVDSGPCQENIITENIDVLKTIPIIKHTEEDAGRILGGGIVLVSGPDGEFYEVGFRRTHFQGKDWASMAFNLGSHMEYHVLKAAKRRAKLPITFNICPSPAVWLAAGLGFVSSISAGSDELGLAGGLQGSPVEICKARTVDAYSIANSEWVIEGYLDTGAVVWESSEAGELGESGKAPFFPEYPGYLGRAYRTFKFQATAITHRTQPIFHVIPAHSLEAFNVCAPFREAAIYDACDHACPGFVTDVNQLDANRGVTGIVIQVRKRRRRDEGYQRNMIEVVFASSPYSRLVVVVDEDVNIYSAEDVLWAINSRVNPVSDLMVVAGVRGDPTSPAGRTGTLESTGISGKLGIDATVPYGLKWLFTRSKFPDINLEKWLTKEDISRAKGLQNEYATFLAEIRS